MTAEIQTLVEATEIDRIHVANQAADNTNLTRNITTITTEMVTIKNLMGTIQSQLNQVTMNGPQVSIHTVTHNCSPGTHPPDKTESYCWSHGRTIKKLTHKCYLLKQKNWPYKHYKPTHPRWGQ